ncbi:unnamed protein product [Heligmosomoides polygyrus]|uniref:procollagen-proline 4-dioxygenase n=1 Tax=Heligmosomoides polygyrus TaxID=6339 RepID=A0A183FU85_HELPZ|nr:unnamed protein product [Heligmosomoides polygyrus]
MQYLLVLLTVLLTTANADLFTSIADMQSLVDSEKSIPAILYKYIDSERQRLEQLAELAQKYDRQNDRDVTEITDISNPIAAFLLIKRKMFDWKAIQQKMMLNQANAFLPSEYGIRYPTEFDAWVFRRICLEPRLDCYDFRIPGDCFEIAKAAYNDGDFYHTILWMEEAKRRLEKEEQPTARLEQILEYLSYSLFKQGNPKHALRLPNHPRAKGNIKWYEDHLAQEGVKKADMRRALGEVTNQRPISALGNEERTIYEALCRNEVPVANSNYLSPILFSQINRNVFRVKRTSRSCTATTNVEIKRFNPLAVLFKEVMSDEEIKVIEELSIPRGWEHEVVDRINKRIDMMTNLNQDTAEELQVQNYGVGGHYDPHFDHARKEETESFKSLGTGNRMTEPLYGGGTVFTDVKSAVLPTKNDALFWYNLYKFGDGDPRTRHAACPVLIGQKWVTNKWIHERGQEFRRRCGLKKFDGERLVCLFIYTSTKTRQTQAQVRDNCWLFREK